MTGIRRDTYAKAYPLQVEVEKSANERGYYIRPELYGAPEERQIDWARNPEQMKRMKELRENPPHMPERPQPAQAKQVAPPRPVLQPKPPKAPTLPRPVQMKLTKEPSAQTAGTKR